MKLLISVFSRDMVWLPWLIYRALRSKSTTATAYGSVYFAA